MNSWFPQIAAIFTQNKQKPKADKLQHFYNSASSLLSIQVNDLTYKRINGLTKSLIDAASTNVLCDNPIWFVFLVAKLNDAKHTQLRRDLHWPTKASSHWNGIDFKRKWNLLFTVHIRSQWNDFIRCGRGKTFRYNIKYLLLLLTSYNHMGIVFAT